VVTNDDGSIDVFTVPNEFLDIRDGLVAAGLEPVYSEVSMIPSTQAELDVDGGRKILKLLDVLEDLDDVQNVYHNASIPEESMEE